MLKTNNMIIKSILEYRDGGTIGFDVYLSVLEREYLNPDSMPIIITVDCGMNGDGQWYLGLKTNGGRIIEDTYIKESLVIAFNEKIQHETLVLENIKQFI